MCSILPFPVFEKRENTTRSMDKGMLSGRQSWMNNLCSPFVEGKFSYILSEHFLAKLSSITISNLSVLLIYYDYYKE